jgi:hypothetical protein
MNEAGVAKGPDFPKKGRIEILMQALEKRMLLDASTLEATVNAIPSAILK